MPWAWTPLGQDKPDPLEALPCPHCWSQSSALSRAPSRYCGYRGRSRLPLGTDG